MNAQQPYEKHLSEKLQQLNPPSDANRNWQQMKALLDRDMPEGGGGGNRGRWWIYGIIAVLLLTGAWFGSSLISGDKKQEPAIAGTNKTANSTEETSPSSDVSLPASEKENNPDGNPANDNSSNPSTTTDKNEKGELATVATPVKATDADSKPIVRNNPDKNSIVNNPAEKVDKTSLKNIKESNVKTNAGNNSVAGTSAEKTNKKNKGSNKGYGSPAKQTAVAPVVVANNGQTNSSKTKNKITGKSEEFSAGAPEEKLIEATLVKQEIRNAEDPDFNSPDSLQPSYAANANMGSVKAKSRFKSNTPRVKALKNREVGTGDNKNFALGLSLPLAFPLGEQNAIAYNFNAGPNTATDYLPIPHMQYHLNQKSYLQAEIQLVGPQYIQPALLSQSKYILAGGTTYKYVTNSVFAEKLYYFSLPIGIHYSPFKNFYVGSGLQFSSLLSGIALYEERGYNSLTPSALDTVYSQSYKKFKDDSISSKLNGNEFRLMMDANYYWHRFTVGLRYNQALSNYVSIKVNNTTPTFTDKNKSMQFYLRYNLWEDKKKKKAGSVAKK